MKIYSVGAGRQRNPGRVRLPARDPGTISEFSTRCSGGANLAYIQESVEAIREVESVIALRLRLLEEGRPIENDYGLNGNSEV